MSSVERRERDGKITWRAHWRDPAGRQHNRTFARQVDAKRYLTTVEGSKLAGSYIDPGRSQATVGALAAQWIAGKVNLKPTTRARYESALSVHVLPRWASTPLARVEHGTVQAWIADLSASGQSGASVRKAYGVLSGVLALAVRDKRINANPAADIDLPPARSEQRRYLTGSQVEQLAAAAGDGRLVVLTLAYCGLRWSELAALRTHRVDLIRRRLEIAEAMTEVNGARIVWGTPKTHEARSVPIPRFIADELAAHIAEKAPGALVFTTPRGAPLRNRNARRAWFNRATAAIGEDGLTPTNYGIPQRP